MLTRLADFFRKYETLLNLLFRLALLLIVLGVARDFHEVAGDVADIADRLDQLGEDVSALRDDVEGDDAAPDTPASLDRSSI
jgi:hypothetical protein